MKTPKKSPAPRAAKPTSAKVKPTNVAASTDRYIGESHSYDSKRPKQPIRSRYQNGTGGAY